MSLVTLPCGVYKKKSIQEGTDLKAYPVKKKSTLTTTNKTKKCI